MEKFYLKFTTSVIILISKNRQVPILNVDTPCLLSYGAYIK